MNSYYAQTRIACPTIDYSTLWTNSADDPADIRPTWKIYRTVDELWADDTGPELTRCGLKPQLIRVFRWAPNLIHPWHVDGNPQNPDKFALNWVLDGSGSIQWNSKLEFPESTVQGAYKYKQGTASDHYESETRGHGCLVNVGIAHRVVNMEPKHRITVSLLFTRYISYEWALRILADRGLIVE
jgi:hypothetical protein